MTHNYDKYDWARHVAKKIHDFYDDVWGYLEDEYGDDIWEVCAGGWASRTMMMVELHCFALRRLDEYRAAHPDRSHLSLSEFITFNPSPEEFAEDFWEHRSVVDSNNAQRLVYAADDGEGILTHPTVAADMLAHYGTSWADLSDAEFEDVWRAHALEVRHRATNHPFDASADALTF